MSSHLRTDLVVYAPEMVLRRRRKPSSGVVHHSDRGVQYTVLSFGKRLEDAGIVSSTGTAGCALDNVLAESFVARLKRKPNSSSPLPLLHPRGGQGSPSSSTRRASTTAGGCTRPGIPRSPESYEEARVKEVVVA
jgi:transposase InsO family protein